MPTKEGYEWLSRTDGWFLMTSDGRHISFDKIPEVQIIDDKNPEIDCPCVHFPSIESLNIALDSYTKVKKYIKLLHRIQNRAERQYRSRTRHIEKERRSHLKHSL